MSRLFLTLRHFMRRFLVPIVAATMLLGVLRGQGVSGLPLQGEELSVSDQLLREARSLFDLGRYGAAARKCRQVLAFDSYNPEALHGLELIRQARAELASRRTDEGRHLGAVVYPQIAWEFPAEKARAARAAALKVKLLGIIIPDVEFRSTPLRDAVAQLSEASRTSAPDGKGIVTIELQLPEAPPAKSTVGPGVPSPLEESLAEPAAIPGLPGLPLGAKSGPVFVSASAETPVTLHLSHLSVLVALTAMGDTLGFKVKVDPDKVLLVPFGTVLDEPMITIAMDVRRSLFLLPKDMDTQTGDVPISSVRVPENPATDGNTGMIEIDPKKFLEASGVIFPPGADALYLKRTSRLIVRNTQDNIDLTQALMTECSFTASPAATPPTNP